MLKIIRRAAGIAFAIAAFSLNFLPGANAEFGLPGRLYLKNGSTAIIQAGIPLTAVVKEEGTANIKINGKEIKQGEAIDLSKPLTISAASEGESRVIFSLGGVFTLRNMAIKVESERSVVPGGHSIGIAFYTAGALVVGTGEISTREGKVINPGEVAEIKSGDIIMKVEDIDVKNSNHLSELINVYDSSITLTILRDGKLIEVEVEPVKDAVDGKRRIGLWVRDSTAGVGTLSYFDINNKAFGCLGHAVTDIDTHSNLLLKEGQILPANIVGIVKGQKGSPGELQGSFFSGSKPIGSILKNTEFGLFGKLYSDLINNYIQSLEVAYQDSVTTGPATILTTIDGSGIQEYTCEITKVSKQRAPASKGIVIKITDSRLLEKTGGIVQGMSGSPIIQNGKLIGAVTHVFINDPQRGYGIYIEWMLEQSDDLQ